MHALYYSILCLVCQHLHQHAISPTASTSSHPFSWRKVFFTQIIKSLTHNLCYRSYHSFHFPHSLWHCYHFNQKGTFPKHTFSNQTAVRGSERTLAQAWCPCLTFWCHDQRLVWALPVAPSHDALLVGVLSLCSSYLYDPLMKTSPLASQRVETG